MTCTRRVSAQTIPLEQQLLAEDAAGIAADSRELGDPARGAFLFHSPGVGCFKCHATAEKIAGIGPDLAAWKRRVDDAHLVESVLQPSAKIEPAYQSRQIITTDGRALVGIEISRNDQQITLQTGIGDADRIVLQVDDIELEKPSDVSLMPAGQVNALRRRQDFLDLIAYLVAIRDGGREVALELQPSEESLRLSVPAYESDLDHRGMIADWNKKSLRRGEKIYRSVCQNCHGTIDQPGSLPTSLRFAEGKFKFGSDPYAMYQTLTFGGGMMMPQTWMVPQQKYDVIQFIREHFLRDHNPDQYFAVSEDYLTSLPSGSSRGPEPQVIEPWITMDYGPMLITTIQFGDGDDNIAQKAIAVRVDDGPGGVARGGAWIAFEHDTLRMAAAWKGDFIDWNGIQFNGRHGVHPSAAGQIIAANPTGPGWGRPVDGSLADDQRIVGRDGRRYGPLPPAWGKFRGLYRFENQVILDYTVGSTKVLERPTSIPIGPRVAFLRTLNLGSRTSDLEMVVMTPGEQADVESLPSESLPSESLPPESLPSESLPSESLPPESLPPELLPSESTVALTSATGLSVNDGRQKVTIIANGFDGNASLSQRDGRIVLRFKKGPRPLSGSLVISDTPWSREAAGLLKSNLKRLNHNLRSMTKGGPAQYPLEVEVPVERWFESEAWAVDELVRPEGNPWLARTRITGLDFSEDGKALVTCTWDGDVWRVDGLESIDNSDRKLRWRRIATGLFQPLGILWETDRVMVTCRDQLVALHDRNNDGEMDHYECFNSDHQVTEHFHEFAMGLQRDAEGRYYYAKSARHALKAVVPHHGTLLRVSSDGSRTDVLATGFRAANGVCLNEDGSFIVTDQEGHWNPKNRINWVRPGGFYGNMYGYHDVTDASDEAMEQPLCWITNEFDRSPAELLWADTDRWGPLNGSLLNLSYGYGRIYVVPHEFADQGAAAAAPLQPQGGMCQLPIPDLPTGMIRGRFSPLDGQLYLGGLFSWAGSRQDQEGGLFRVQYRGERMNMPVGLHAAKDEMVITFSDPLDRRSSAETDRYSVRTWDLKRTKQYGSEHYNERELEVERAELSEDGRTLRLALPDLKPTWGMEIVCRLKGSDGKEFRRVIHNTVHFLAPR